MKLNNTVFCTNCGKNGHFHRNCLDPITSYGIINIRINSDKFKSILLDKLINHDKFTTENNYSINTYISSVIIDEKLYEEIKNSVQFLLIRRKYTLGYLEFVRGNYNPDIESTIDNIALQLTEKEYNFVKNNTFEKIWEDLWGETSYKKNYMEEFIESKKKFEKLKEINYFEREFDFPFKEPEWGIPKGRRNNFEKNLKCAIREFMEETGLKNNEFTILNKVFPVNETFFGTNGIRYKHVYFIGLDSDGHELTIDEKNHFQTSEVGDIKWCSYDECVNLIRPYHSAKKKVLEDTLNFIVNIINEERQMK